MIHSVVESSESSLAESPLIKEEPVQVAAMRVEKHDIESVNRTTSFSSNQVTTLIRERKSLT